MAEVGEVRAKFRAEWDEWIAGIEKMQSATTEFVGAANVAQDALSDKSRATGEAVMGLSERAKAYLANIGVQIDQQSKIYSDRLGQMGQAAAQFRQKHEFAFKALDAAGGALPGFAATVAGYTNQLHEARSRHKAILREMRATFGEHAVEMTRIAEDQLRIGIDPAKAADALQNLNRFQQASEANLKLVEDAAARTGRSMDGMAQKVGKAFQDLETGSPTAARSVQALMKEIGASPEAMKRFGARLDENNKVMTDTPARAAAAEAALKQYLGTFKGAAEAAASPVTRLKGEMELLKREISEGAVPLQERLAPAMLSVVQKMRSFSPEAKAMVGATIQFTSSAANGAVQALALGSQIAMVASNAQASALATRALMVSVTALRTAFQALFTTTGLGIAVMASGLLLLHETTEAIKGQTAAQEELLKIEERRAAGLRKNIDLIGKSADELRKMGKTSSDVRDVIEGLHDQLEKAREAKNAPLISRLEQQIRDAQRVKGELADGESKARDKQHQDGLDDPSAKERKKMDQERRKAEKEEAREREKERREEVAQALAAIHQQAAARKISHQEQIDLLKDLERQHTLSASERRRVEAEIARLEGGEAKEKAKAEEKARKTAFDVEHAQIKQLAAAKVISHQQEIDRLQELLQKSQLTGQERIRIETEIAHLRGQIEAEHTRVAKHEEAKRKREAELSRRAVLKEALGHIDEEAKARRISIQEEIDGLNQVLKAYKLTSSEKLAIAQKVAALEGRLRAGETRDARQEQHDKEEIGRAHKGARAAREREIDTRVSMAEDKHKETGQNTIPEITKLLNEKLRLQVAEIEEERRLAVEKTKNVELIRAAEEEAQAKIRQAHAETTKRLHEETAKQMALKAKASGMADGPYGVQDLAAQMSATFGSEAVNRRISEIRSDPTRLTGWGGQGGGGMESIQLKPPSDPTPIVSPAEAAGKAVGKAVGEALNVTIQVVMPGGGTQSKTFTGTQTELARSQNTFNPAAPLGRF